MKRWFVFVTLFLIALALLIHGSAIIQLARVSSPRNLTLDVGSVEVAPRDIATATPTPGVVQFSSDTYSVQEDCTTVTITVNRLGDASAQATVDYSTADMTATERSDYITALGTLHFAAGETSKSF